MPTCLMTKSNRYILFVIIILSTVFAWSNRFITDDAFISFRYAYNLASGNGLVWNLNEFVEGYTNFAWTLLLSIPFLIGWDVVIFSQLSGIVFFALSLLYTYKLASNILGDGRKSLLCVIILGFNFTYVSYATGGLETSMQSLLVVLAYYLYFLITAKSKQDNIALIAMSLLLFLSVTTRPDAFILAAVIFGSIGTSFLLREMNRKRAMRNIVILIFPFLALVSLWVMWKMSYYGDIVPNTFHAKVRTGGSIRQGLYYVGLFFLLYLYVPNLIIHICAIRRVYSSNGTLLSMSCFLLLWTLYVIYVGGDFMEFRFMAPTLPLFSIIFCWHIFFIVRYRAVRAMLVGLLLFGSLHSYLWFANHNFKGIESIHSLDSHISSERWDLMGAILGKALNYSKDTTIATTAAGAIPFYSGLNAIDMHGLTDKWIARNGIVFDQFQLGHNRFPTLSYLLKRNVNIIIGRPIRYIKEEYVISDLQRFGVYLDIKELPLSAGFLHIPVTKTKLITTIYLKRSPVVDEAIRKYNWVYTPIIR